MPQFSQDTAPQSRRTYFNLMRMFHTCRVLPGVNDVVNDFINAHSMLYLRENKGAGSPHSC